MLDKKFADICAENEPIRCYNKVTQKVISAKTTTTVSQSVNPTRSAYGVATISPIINSRQSVLGAILIGKQGLIEGALDGQEHSLTDVYQKAIINNISALIWLKDTENKFLVVNKAFAEAAGQSDPNDLKGKTDYDFFPKELAAGYIEDDKKIRESGDPAIVVEQIKKKNGELYWAETYKSPVIIDGKPLGTVGYSRDISEHRHLLSVVTNKELEYATLVKNLPLSIIKYDKNCKRLFISGPDINLNEDDFQRFLGKSPEELWDSNVIDITAAEYQSKLRHVIRSSKKHTFEMQCKSADDVTVSMVSMLPEYDAENKIMGVLAIANDVTEISKYRQDLEYLAYHDHLTSLPNRAFFNQRIKEIATSGEHFGLMLMDLDFFKTINDTLGHAVGDELLIDAAKRIVAAIREEDIVARIGGDEFAILVTNLKDDADMGALAAKISKKLSTSFSIEGIDFFVTASIGIACYPADSEAVEDLIKYADTAMYSAKKLGRDNYQYYRPELTEHAMEHLAIATALRYAINKNELSLLYQPKVDIGTSKVIGVEALLRWQGKVLGQIKPDKFIPIAEESGLIVDIGAWVLKASCGVVVQLNQHRKIPLNMAVNVSSKEFAGNNYIENLQYCLQETGCKPEWLTLEITESLLLQDSKALLETLIKIDEMGVALAIDDFGTGYSALAYLSKFPIRQVKIDRSFVMDICNTHSAASLIKAIIAMTVSLNKELVAEGVETKEQAALIKQMGCDQAQGYLYSKPISYPDLLLLLEQ